MLKSTKIVEAMTPAQCRAARALLDYDQAALASKASLGLSTVVDFERERRVVSAKAKDAIRAALEAAGAEFTNGDQPGVRIKLYRLKDAGHEAFPVDLDFIGVGVIDAKRNITIRVERSALDYLGDRRIGAGGDHMRAFDEHRDRIIRIADEKYKRGIIEPDDIVLVMYADVANR